MWTMPRKTLQIVAFLIAACAVGGFILGVRGAPDPARLPGEGLPTTGGTPLVATDATPLVDSVEPPKPPPEPEEDEKTDEAKAEDAAKTPEVKPADAPPAPVAAPPPAPPEDKVGDLLDGVTPPPDAPIY
jgi:hypothetical protein